MNKRIKLISLIILILLAFGLVTTSQATSQATTEEYSPAGLFPQKVGTATYYCKQKGGALRFFVPDRDTVGYGEILPKDTDYEEITDIEDTSDVTEQEKELAKELEDRKQELGELIEELGEYVRAYKIPGSNYNGDFPDAPGEWYVTWDKDDLDKTKDYPQFLYEVEGKLLAGTPKYEKESAYSEKNNRIAYLLTSGKNWTPNEFNKSNYQGTIGDSATEQDIQHALWRDDAYNEGSNVNYDTKKLYEEAIAYENFYKNYIKNGYQSNDIKISLNSQTPTVIVNKVSGTYIVGPYVMTYPDDPRFSFVEDICVKDQSNNRINVKVIAQSGSTYPRSGENFFIEFSNNTNPTKIQVCAKFAYLQEVGAKYEKWVANDTPIYKYVGRLYAKVNATTNVSYTRVPLSSVQGDLSGYVSWGNLPDEWKEKYKDYAANTNFIYEKIEQSNYGVSYAYNTYLLLAQDEDENDLTYDAQTSAKIEENDKIRVWKTTDEITSTSIVDISMKIGGKVFVDVAATKESNVDGIYNSNIDKPMPGVQVELYSQRGGLIGTTTTDVNGNYVFTNLNVLDKYYVRFVYNGQYYEPTYYTTPNNTGNYKNTSNGTDYAKVRADLNLRFASIGSSPANYDTTIGYDSQYVRDQIINSKYNRTFSKMQLLGYTLNSEGNWVKTRDAVIDSFCSKCNENQKHNPTEKCYETFGNLTTKYRNADVAKLTELEKQMVQYVKDCKMYSWTKNSADTIDFYPNSSVLVISNSCDKITGQILQYNNVKAGWNNLSDYSSIIGVISGAVDDKSQYINQGYKVRQEADVALKEDVYSAKIEINGRSEDYLYNQREGKTTEANEKGWDIGARIAEGYYGTLYSREIYASDYQFKVSDYGKEFSSKYNKTLDDELNIYVTYKIDVRNRSQSIRTRIDEIVHYYDSDYEYVADRSYIELPDGTKQNNVKVSTTSRYSSIPGTTTTLNGYQTMYITALDGIYLEAGQKACIYLTFIIEKSTVNGEKWVKLDENAETAEAIGLGKESITEINGYSTLYKEGTDIPNIGRTGINTIAGVIDVDSNPGNLNPNDVPKDGKIKYENFEDDTDKAPNLRVVLYRGQARIVTGYVWEDERNLINNSQATATGNGIREDKEKLINGVTVQFVEIMDNGQEYIWREFGSNITGPSSVGKGTGSGTKTTETPIINVSGVVPNHNFTGDTKGTYAFKSFIPGNYIVRFKYGDTVRTVLTNNSEVTSLLGQKGLNDVSYNGQDYKSTIYQAGLGTYNGKNTSKQYNYDIAKADNAKALLSDAKDLYNIRENVINYSNGTVKNAFAELLSSYEKVPVYNNSKYDKNTVQSYLNEFIAKTAMTAETGIINMQVEYNRGATEYKQDTTYHMTNLDLGLEQRPKAQIEINKDVKNLKITLADGNVLFDAAASVDNLLWQPNPLYYAYVDNKMDPNKFSSLDAIRTQRTFGLIQPTMDQELMHGATVRIIYEITAKNIGETDYKEQQFYYTGVVKDKNTISTTNAIQLVDYVPNNLQYYEEDNKGYWTVISKDKVKEQLIDTGLVNSRLQTNLEKFNTIVTTTKTNTALYPTIYTEKVDKNKVNSVSVPIVLTQLITSENKTADLTYNNVVELVAQSNTIGRKMAYSVPGNQDPTKDITELDADKSTVRILPPFGAVLTYTIIALITIAGAAIIVVGIIFIKKKVLTK